MRNLREKEIISRLYSTEPDVRKEAVYRILFDRRHNLIPDLKEAAIYEKNEEIAILIAQTCLTLEAFPRDPSLERQILEHLQRKSGTTEMNQKMWEYLATHGSSQMLIATMGAMGETIPTKAHDFMDACLNHIDPEVRAMACQVAVNSGRPTHFAQVLNLVTDADKLVSETAFKVIKALPSEQMKIILDYALGSPDEWVLQNVAPFLPLLINNDLRKVIAKVQYHNHPLVAKKAREALKELDSIPFVSKRKRERLQKNKIESKADASKDKAQAQADEKKDGEFVSFKQEMEEKRRKRMEEEEKKRAENEKIEAELAQTSPEEIQDFANSVETFSDEAEDKTDEKDTEELVIEKDDALKENLEFEKEQSAISEIDDNAEIIEAEPQKENDEKKLEDDSVVANKADDDSLAQSEAEEQSSKKHESSQIESVEIENVDFEEISQQIDDSGTEEIEIQNELALQEAAEVQKTDENQKTEEASEKEVKNASLEDQKGDIKESVSEKAEAEVEKKEEQKEATTIKPPPKKLPTDAPEKKTKSKERPARESKNLIKIQPIPAAQTIISRFPSFISTPFSVLFKPASEEQLLNVINKVSDNLIAYLNLCFLQSCMFFAPPSAMLEKSVKDCLKGHLIGPTALRCLHNFALAMKQSKENPVFFTFSLSKILSDSSDTNPLMMLRELREYLKQPIEPLNETIPQAVEGLAEILRGTKSILNNSIVMKTPKGTKVPFADLTGPLAVALKPDKRPGIELPESELVVLSRDGTEAFGLFPYFKYANRRMYFSKPGKEEFAILLERLEVEL
ncbi:MAG: hypothetical protein ACQETH_00820 [Candidatus Rifleibacteriota bacterium]